MRLACSSSSFALSPSLRAGPAEDDLLDGLSPVRPFEPGISGWIALLGLPHPLTRPASGQALLEWSTCGAASTICVSPLLLGRLPLVVARPQGQPCWGGSPVGQPLPPAGASDQASAPMCGWISRVCLPSPLRRLAAGQALLGRTACAAASPPASNTVWMKTDTPISSHGALLVQGSGPVASPLVLPLTGIGGPPR